MSDRRLTLVVPARDEEARLGALLERLADAHAVVSACGFELSEVIVVDDSSTDRTAELVRAHESRVAGLRLVAARGGAGKGAAVRTGMLAATTPWALLTDVDLATPLEDLDRLAAAAARGADVALGSRGLRDSEIAVHQPFYRERAGKAFNLLVRLLTGLPYADTQCGFKLYRLAAVRTVFERQRTNGFAFDVENLLEARRLGLRVEEVPVRWANDAHTKVRFVRASAAMALDLVRVAIRFRRLPRRPAQRELARGFRS